MPQKTQPRTPRQTPIEGQCYPTLAADSMSIMPGAEKKSEAVLPID